MDYEFKTMIRGYITDDSDLLMAKINSILRKAGFAILKQGRVEHEFGEDYCDAGFTVESEEGPAERDLRFTYAIDESEGSVYIDIDIDEYAAEIAQWFIDQYEEMGVTASISMPAGRKKISASKSRIQRIVAADEDDEFGGNDFGEEEFGADGAGGDPDNPDEVEDDIDDLGDTIGDLQEMMDGVEEDDIDIELDANIENHFIVQCDGCHDIFISALVESDQEVEKISGVCPCCEKETDQYIKWIVRAL